jgi:hypothetical protein
LLGFMHVNKLVPIETAERLFDTLQSPADHYALPLGAEITAKGGNTPRRSS